MLRQLRSVPVLLFNKILHNRQVIRSYAECWRTLKMRTLIGHIVLLAAMAAVAPPTVGGQIVESSGSDDKRIENEVSRVNAEEVQAFIHNDSKTMAHLWSDDFVVTNPLNRFVTKQQVLGMVDSGFLAIPPYDRQIEYLHVYGDVVIVAGSETVVWGGKMPNVYLCETAIDEQLGT